MADKRREDLKRALKHLRHPLLDDLAGLWAPSIAPTAPLPYASISEVPDLKAEVTKAKNLELMPNFVGTRETALAKACDLFAKAGEAVNASSTLVSQGTWLSAAILHYDACYYIAKSCCHLMGFAQYNASSSYLIDIFPSPPGNKTLKTSASVDNIRLHQIGRWEHLNVWHLLGRVAHTAKGTQASIFDPIKKIDLDRISDRRNSYLYDNRYFGLPAELSYIDIPSNKIYDLVSVSKSRAITSDYDDAAYYHALFRVLNELVKNLATCAQVASAIEARASSKRISAMAA